MYEIDLIRALKLIAEQNQVLDPKDRLSSIIAFSFDEEDDELGIEDQRQISAAQADPEYRKRKDHDE